MKKRIISQLLISNPSNPIEIDATTNVATVTESAGYGARFMAGVEQVLNPVASAADGITRNEAVALFYGTAILTCVGSSMLTRSRVKKGRAPIAGCLF